jgi:hypothetical protein
VNIDHRPHGEWITGWRLGLKWNYRFRNRETQVDHRRNVINKKS